MSNDLFFLPSYIRLFTNLVTCTSPNLGSGSVVCLTAFLRIVQCVMRDLLLGGLFLALGAVLAAALTAAFNTSGVEHTANDVVLHARQVFHTTTAHEHDTVLLQVVAFTADIGDHLVL